MAITTIVPTITAQDPTVFQQTFTQYSEFAKRLHVDIADGTLTPNTLVDINQIQWPTTLAVDVHVMSDSPSQYLDRLIQLKPNLVVFHAEAREDLLPIFDRLHQAEINAGVVIMKNVYVGNIKNVLTNADHALIFSGTLGQQGGQAEMLLLEKVALIRDIKPSIEVGWDGGANLDNTHIITHSGVDVINVGGAISRADNPEEAFKALSAATEKDDAI